MMTKTIFTRIRGLQIQKAAPLALLLLQGNQVLAQTTSSKTSEGVSALEILGYVAMIIGVILLAWVIGSWQSRDTKRHEISHRSHRHFDHPNDPHFRKLKKKTS